MLWRYLQASFAFRFALVMALLGLMPVGLAVFEAARTHRRLADFYPAKARILEKRMLGGRGGPSYSFRVRYLDHAGLSHERKVNASKGEYLYYRVSDEAPVYVSGVDTEDAWLASSGKPNYGQAKAFGTVAAILFLPLVAVAVWLSRRVAVLRDGQRTVGRVEKMRRDTRIRLTTKYKYVMVFSYTGPDGRIYRRRSLHLPKKLADTWKERSEISVYFDPAHPWLAEADVFGVREA